MKTQRTPTCMVIRSTEMYEGKQRTFYSAAVSAESVGALGICMHLVTVPPASRAKAHLHQNHESAIYVLSGEGGMWYGEKLQEHLIVRGGDFLYIPAGVPHLPYNLSQTEPLSGVVSRTDPNEQESVVLLPELDELH